MAGFIFVVYLYGMRYNKNILIDIINENQSVGRDFEEKE